MSSLSTSAVSSCGCPFATEDQPLLRGEILSSAPLSDFEGHMGIGLLDFPCRWPIWLYRAARRLRCGFDIAKGIVMRHHGQPTDDKEHAAPAAIRIQTLAFNISPSFHS